MKYLVRLLYWLLLLIAYILANVINFLWQFKLVKYSDLYLVTLIFIFADTYVKLDIGKDGRILGRFNVSPSNPWIHLVWLIKAGYQGEINKP